VGWTTQCSLLAQRWQMLLLRHCIGGGPGVEPAGLPFWVIVITIHICGMELLQLWSVFRFVKVYRLAARSGGAPPDLAGPFFFIFEIQFSGPHWAFSHYHMAAHDWATWKPTIGPCQPLAQSPATSPTTSSRHVRSATWLYGLPHGTFSLVHGLTQKCQK
jgi:hypothetical protein